MPSKPAPSTGATPPVILDNARKLLRNYEVLFCDVWGVVHDGLAGYPEANAALTEFRKQGGSVILVSNAPVPNNQVRMMLDERRLSRDAYDDIVSSGDIAIEHLSGQNYRRIHAIGPMDRDAALFEMVDAELTGLENAEAILCSGLNDDINETAESYRERLNAALARNLPFVCANPDKVVDVAGRLYLCAGAIADLYEHMGGQVFWAGKPYPPAYDTALERTQEIRGKAVSTESILVIGDALRTDIIGAQRAGIDALFIAGGIHREDLMQDDRICPDKLARLFDESAPPAVAAMSQLRL